MSPNAASGLGDALTAPCYRTVEEARIVASLTSPYAIVGGRRPQDERLAAAALERCVDLGLPFRLDPARGRLFDPVEVVNGIKHLYVSRGEPIWIERSVNVLRRLMAEALPDASPASPPDLSRLGEARYAVTLRRRFGLAGRRPGERLRLRLPLPLDGLEDVQFLAPPGPPPDARVAPGRLEVRLATPEAAEVEIGVRVRFIARPIGLGGEPPLDSAEQALWTRPREGLIQVDDRIRALATDLTAGANGPWEVMRRLWDHLFDAFRLGFIHYDRIDPVDPMGETLRTRRFDCRTGSSLLAALCRALDMPARVAAGYTLNPVMPTEHSWCEVWMPDSGWAAFDLYAMDLAGGEPASPWRQHYFGRLDHRFVAERLPLAFCGAGAVRLPPAWQLVGRRVDAGAENTYEALTTGELVYAETVDVLREA